MGNTTKIPALLIVVLLLLSGCNTVQLQEPSAQPEQATDSATENATPGTLTTEPVLADEVVLYMADGRSDGDIRHDWLHYASPKYGEDTFRRWWQRISNDDIRELRELPIKAIIADFTYGLTEHFDLAASLRQIREEYPDLLIISIRPCEFIDEVIELSDLVIFDDYIAWGQRVPQFVSNHGAQALVKIDYEIVEPERSEYSTDHFNDGLAFHKANRAVFTQSLWQTCDTLGLFYASDTFDSELRRNSEQYVALILEKVQHHQNINGSTCFIYPAGREDLNRKACETGAYLLPMITSTNDQWYAYSFMLDDEKSVFANDIEKRFDYAWANQKIAEGVARLGATGRVFRDPASNIMLPIEAATKYTLAFMAGDTSLKTANQDFFSQCLQETMDEFGCPDYQVYVNTYEGYEGNCLFFSTDLIAY